LYFAAANLKTINTNIGSAKTIHGTYSHGVIFSSDTTNSCYQLSANPPGSLINMASDVISTTINFFNPIGDIAILPDTASVFNDLVHDKITRVSWCI
jgi:hypothetical protein